MSWKATAYVKEIVTGVGGKKLTRAEKLLAIILADYHRTDGKPTFPSTTTLAKDSLTDERYCRRLLQSLADNGIIEIIHPENQGQGRCNQYIFPAIDKVGTDYPPSADNKGGTSYPPSADDKGGNKGGTKGGSKGGNFSQRNKEQQGNGVTGKQRLSSPPNGDDQKVTPDQQQTLKRVWVDYIHKLGRDPKAYTATDARKKKGYSRLRECLVKTGGDLAAAEAMMKRAIDALASSTYHREGGWVDWSENLFKSADKLEWWLDRRGGKREAMEAEQQRSRGPSVFEKQRTELKARNLAAYKAGKLTTEEIERFKSMGTLDVEKTS